MTGSGFHIGWALEAVLLAERELLLFAGFWLAIGLLDELAVDLAWFWLKVSGRARTRSLPPGYGQAPLAGPMAVFIPAFAESAVIGTTIRSGSFPTDAMFKTTAGRIFRSSDPTPGSNAIHHTSPRVGAASESCLRLTSLPPEFQTLLQTLRPSHSSSA